MNALWIFDEGHTTFSSFSLQTLNLVEAGEWAAVGGNAIRSGVSSLVGACAGLALAVAVRTAKGA